MEAIMKQHITLIPLNAQNLVLPIQYNHMIQAMIYNTLDADLGRFLHEKGFNVKKRTFKMFSFSRLMGNYTLNQKEQKISFEGPVNLTISSPYDDFCNSIASGILLKEQVRLGSVLMKVKEVTFEKEIVDTNQIKVNTLSPMVVYSTFFRSDGRKYTCYFQPGEKEHADILESNIRKKYSAFYNEEPPEGCINLKSLGKTRLSVVNYKGTIIKGYSGKFILQGPIPLLQMALDVGLGSKNSQGFGCIKYIKQKRR